MGDDHVLGAEVLVDHVVMVQVAELAEHLYCDLCHVIHREGLLQVAQMVEVILALIHKLIYDIDVVLRLENVQIRLDTLLVEAL